MKRYLLFIFGQYYPRGGANDFRGAFDSIDKAKAFVDIKGDYEREVVPTFRHDDLEANILDVQTMQPVCYMEYNYYKGEFEWIDGSDPTYNDSKIIHDELDKV
jgi:hypothetical protein